MYWKCQAAIVHHRSFIAELPRRIGKQLSDLVSLVRIYPASTVKLQVQPIACANASLCTICCLRPSYACPWPCGAPYVSSHIRLVARGSRAVAVEARHLLARLSTLPPLRIDRSGSQRRRKQTLSPPIPGARSDYRFPSTLVCRRS